MEVRFCLQNWATEINFFFIDGEQRTFFKRKLATRLGEDKVVWPIWVIGILLPSPTIIAFVPENSVGVWREWELFVIWCDAPESTTQGLGELEALDWRLTKLAYVSVVLCDLDLHTFEMWPYLSQSWHWTRWLLLLVVFFWVNELLFGAENWLREL